MSKGVGQSKREWKTQISDLPRFRELDKQTKEKLINDYLEPFGIDTTKERTILEARLRIREIISRLKQTDNLDEIEKAYIEYYGNIDIINPVNPFDNLKESEAKEKIVIEKIKELFSLRFLQRLKSRKKDGIVDANILETMDTEKNLINFATSLSVSEWEDLYKQSTKIAKMKGLNVVPVLDIDKHFCKIFDMSKVKKVLPGVDNYILFDAWIETIGYSSDIMKNLLKSDRRKKQLDFLALTIFYPAINRISDELISDNLCNEIKKYDNISQLESNKDIKQRFIKQFNEKYKEFFIIDKKEFIQLYQIPERTFYRRQSEDYLPYRKSLLEDIDGKKYMNFNTYYKKIYKIKPFSVSEEIE